MSLRTSNVEQKSFNKEKEKADTNISFVKSDCKIEQRRHLESVNRLKEEKMMQLELTRVEREVQGHSHW